MEESSDGNGKELEGEMNEENVVEMETNSSQDFVEAESEVVAAERDDSYEAIEEVTSIPSSKRIFEKASPVTPFTQILRVDTI